MSNSLTWGLVVATYKRELILPICLELVIQQTRQPSEIIIVDASPYWETTKHKILSTIAAANSHIAWKYLQAKMPSIAIQRNQGIQLATADILFLLDDDSLMFPNCAAEIMKVYEADVEGQVSGVQAFADKQLPPNCSLENIQERKRYIQEQATGNSDSKLEQIKRSLKAVNLYPGERFTLFVGNQILLNEPQATLIPYDAWPVSRKLPLSLKSLQVKLIPAMVGFKMTYRRQVLAGEFFEPLFLKYSALEDFDASYRASRKGILVEAIDAKLHHYKASSGIIYGQQKTAITLLNQSFLLRKHSDFKLVAMFRFYLLTFRRLLAFLCRSLLYRRIMMPDIKGVAWGALLAFYVFSVPQKKYEKVYAELQNKVLGI